MRAIIRGVVVAGEYGFKHCYALTLVECPKLERIGQFAFSSCFGLTSIDIFSVKIIDYGAFYGCGLKNAQFGTNLEMII